MGMLRGLFAPTALLLLASAGGGRSVAWQRFDLTVHTDGFASISD